MALTPQGPTAGTAKRGDTKMEAPPQPANSVRRATGAVLAPPRAMKVAQPGSTCLRAHAPSAPQASTPVRGGHTQAAKRAKLAGSRGDTDLTHVRPAPQGETVLKAHQSAACPAARATIQPPSTSAAPAQLAKRKVQHPQLPPHATIVSLAALQAEKAWLNVRSVVLAVTRPQPGRPSALSAPVGDTHLPDPLGAPAAVLAGMLPLGAQAAHLAAQGSTPMLPKTAAWSALKAGMPAAVATPCPAV